ncbi:MAG: hypothetical protein QOD06_862 [Candidatus Binatota bacterium]|nr:hypothetical protein [Candidatus Binatota bacterium]
MHLAPVLLGLALMQTVPAACMMAWKNGASPERQEEEEWGGVEVLGRRGGSADDPEESKSTVDKGGEILVVFTFLSAVLAAAALPFLLL